MVRLGLGYTNFKMRIASIMTMVPVHVALAVVANRRARAAAAPGA